MGIREAYGVLKDSTTVKLAKVNSEYKDLDIAIVKATDHVEAPPKERYVRQIFAATSVSRPRADVAYCTRVLAKRLAKTSNWIVAIKVLIVVHRTLREGDPTFREMLMKYSHRERVLNLANFKDDTGHRAWDCSSWVCKYALYLEERIACFRVLKYDIESERLKRDFPGATKVHSKTRLLSAGELLVQLPALQQLLYRLVACEPSGVACSNYLIQYSLALVLKESFKIYCAINDGIINLFEVYFDMPKNDAVKALGIYKSAGLQADSLGDFYDFCKHLALAKNFQFPTLRHPPPSFLATLEEYIKEAPQAGSVSMRRPDSLARVDKEEIHEEVIEQLVLEEEGEAKNEEEEPEALSECESLPLISTDYLLGLNDFDLKNVETEESNVPTVVNGITSNGSDPHFLDTGLDNRAGIGWEMAPVSAPSNNPSPTAETHLGDRFNKLSLDNLYVEDPARRQQMQNTELGFGYGNGMATQNPFEQQQNLVGFSYGIAPPTNVQMSRLSPQPQMFQQQQLFQQQQMFPQQQMFRGPFPQYPVQQQPQDTNTMYHYHGSSQFPQQQLAGVNPLNPFADPCANSTSNTRPQHSNLEKP